MSDFRRRECFLEARRSCCDSTSIPWGAMVYFQFREPSKSSRTVFFVLVRTILSAVHIKHLETIDHRLGFLRQLLYALFFWCN